MIINIKEEMTCRRRTHNFMASPCHPLFGRVTILGMIIKKKKLYYVNRPYLWIETKSLPNHEFKWKQENFPLIHVPLSISCKCILKLNWSSTFSPLENKYKMERSNTHLSFVLIIKPTKKKELNALQDHQLCRKNCNSCLHVCNIICISCTWMHRK